MIFHVIMILTIMYEQRICTNLLTIVYLHELDSSTCKGALEPLLK